MSNLLLNNTLSNKMREEVVERNPSLWRGIVIEIISILSAVWLGYIYKLFISDQPFFLTGVVPGFWGVVIALSFFFLASLFHAVLIKDAGRRTAMQIIQILALGLFLYNESVSWLLTEGIALILLLAGSWRARSELKNNVGVRFFRVAGMYYARLVMALALLATIFYFPYWELHKTIVPEPAFQGLATWSVGIVNSFYPDIQLTPNSTFEEIASSLADRELQKNSSTAQLSLAERQQLNAKATTVISEQIKNQLGGITPEPNESLISFFYRISKQGIEQLEKQMGQWFFFGWILIVLLISFSIGRLYSFIMSAAAFIIYQILLASRFINLYTETVTKETLDF